MPVFRKSQSESERLLDRLPQVRATRQANDQKQLPVRKGLKTDHNQWGERGIGFYKSHFFGNGNLDTSRSTRCKYSRLRCALVADALEIVSSSSGVLWRGGEVYGGQSF